MMAKIAIIDVKGSVTYRDESLPDLAPDETLEDYQAAVQAAVDDAARSRRYADGNSLASYDGSTVPEWDAEAKAFKAWRDKVWLFAYAELSKVQAGGRDQPSVADFLLELPVIVWP